MGDVINPTVAARISAVVLRALFLGSLEKQLSSHGLHLEEFDFRLKSGVGRAPFVVELKANYPLLFGLTSAKVELNAKGTVVLSADGVARLAEVEVGGPGIKGLTGVLASPFVDAVDMVRRKLTFYSAQTYPLQPYFSGLKPGRFTLTCAPDLLTIEVAFDQGVAG